MCGSWTSPLLPSLPSRSVSVTALSHRWERCDRNCSLLSLLTGPLSLGLRLLEGENDLAMLRIMFLPFPGAVLGRGGMGFGQRFSPVSVARLPGPPVGPLWWQHGVRVCVHISVCLHVYSCGAYTYTHAGLCVGMC